MGSAAADHTPSAFQASACHCRLPSDPPRATGQQPGAIVFGPDGGWHEADAWGNWLPEAQTDGAPFPEGLVFSAPPRAAQAEQCLATIARPADIGVDVDDGTEVEGQGANGLRIEVDVIRDGRRKRFERELTTGSR